MKKLLAVLLAGILALSLAACGGSAEPSSTPAPASQAAPAESGDAAEPAAAGAAGKKISILTANLSSVTTNQMCEMMKAGMEKEGMEVTSSTPRATSASWPAASRTASPPRRTRSSS